MSGRAWIKQAFVLSVLVWPWAAAASGNWHYVINQPRREQQANFCGGKKDIEEIAGIFTRYGARAGYAALSGSPNCQVAVKTFTPREVLITVTISKGMPGEYDVRFVEVEGRSDETMYLVTTRDVVAE
jgi:hypothetical protein